MAQAVLNGLRFNYCVDGDAAADRAIILSNSLAASTGMWDAQVPALTAAGYRVVRYDHRGHGGTEVAATPFTFDDLADDVVALQDELGLERADFCGLSMGGMTGQMLAARHPTRVGRLCLAATAAHLNAPDVWNERIALVEDKGLAAVVDGTMERWFVPAAADSMPDALAAVRAAILATPAAGYCACCNAIRDMDLREAVTTIDAPTLVIVGGDDASTPVAASEFIHQRIAGSKLVVVPGGRHLFNIDHADAFNAALLEFLNA